MLPSETDIPASGRVRYDQHLHVLVTSDLADQLDALASRNNKKVSEVVRDAIRRHVATAGVDILRGEVDA